MCDIGSDPKKMSTQHCERTLTRNINSNSFKNHWFRVLLEHISSIQAKTNSQKNFFGQRKFVFWTFFFGKNIFYGIKFYSTPILTMFWRSLEKPQFWPCFGDLWRSTLVLLGRVVIKLELLYWQNCSTSSSWPSIWPFSDFPSI